MASRIFLSMFLSSILIILSLFIPVMYLMMNDFWFYSTVLISLFMLHYSFNIIDNTEISDKGKESLSTLSYNSVNKMNPKWFNHDFSIITKYCWGSRGITKIYINMCRVQMVHHSIIVLVPWKYGLYNATKMHNSNAKITYFWTFGDISKQILNLMSGAVRFVIYIDKPTKW